MRKMKLLFTLFFLLGTSLFSFGSECIDLEEAIYDDYSVLTKKYQLEDNLKSWSRASSEFKNPQAYIELEDGRYVRLDLPIERGRVKVDDVIGEEYVPIKSVVETAGGLTERKSTITAEQLLNSTIHYNAVELSNGTRISTTGVNKNFKGILGNPQATGEVRKIWSDTDGNLHVVALVKSSPNGKSVERELTYSEVNSLTRPLRLPRKIKEIFLGSDSQSLSKITLKNGFSIDLESDTRFVSFIDEKTKEKKRGMVVDIDKEHETLVISALVLNDGGYSEPMKLSEAEINTLSPSKTSRSLADAIFEDFSGKIADDHAPAGKLDVEVLRPFEEEVPGKRFASAKEYNNSSEKELSKFKKRGAKFKKAIDANGSSVKTAALHSDYHRDILFHSFKTPYKLVEGLAFIDVYNIEKLPEPGNAHALMPALRHPNMANALKVLKEYKTRLDLDAGLGMLTASGFYFTKESITIGPNTSWHVFAHEFQHMLFHVSNLEYHYEEIVKGFAQGKKIEQILNPVDLHFYFNKWASLGLKIDSFLESAKLGLPAVAANETAAVQVELDLFEKEARREPKPEEHELEELRHRWISQRQYALEWQIYELKKVENRNAAQRKALSEARDELRSTKCPF